MTNELRNNHFRTFTMVKKWNYLTKIILLSCLAIYQCQALNAPTIDLHPKAEVAYRAESEILVECAANPASNSEYKWKKNGVEYPVPNRGPISFLDPGRLGTIRFTKPTEQDEGEYQCFATNEFGTAVSTRAVLKKAFFDPFKTVTGPEIKNPTVGNSETLKCSPPASYPKDTPYWGIGRPNDKKYQNLNTSDRIQVDYDGNLHFANIREDDFLTMERFYTCIVYNSELRASVAGNDVKIFPQSVSGDIPRQAPSLLWSSPKSDKAVKGHDKKLKCIFGGYPTPRVTWRRKNGERNSRMQETQDGHGTELLISNTQESDAGEYICTATAGQSSESATINLRIESPPFWNQGKSPANVEVEEDGEASFSCEAYGYPRPKIEWGINGVNIDKLGSDSRRRLEGNTLTFTDLKKGDNKVIQCVATNEHGTILANAHLIVISAPPSFTRTPNDTTVVQGRQAKLECLAYGAPKPEIKWKKGNPPEEVRNDGWNYIIHTNGTLEILRAERHDEGDYFCIAKNRHDETQAKARINVRQPTTISTPKSEEKVNRTEDATLQCDANTDPAERSNLKVVWLKNDEPIDYNKDRHLTYNSQTYSLTIKRSMVKDTAVYKCNASNGLDSAESGPINLIVRDRPEPPTDITIDSCTAEYSDISFLPGSDNNDPIKQFTVYYSVDSEPDMVISKVILPPHSGKFDPKKRVGGNDGRLNLTPWRNYTFSVAAENSLGASEPSTSSSSVCRTQEARPTKNPENVCSRLQGTEKLIITWSPVAREHHHGSDYRYVVGYRPFRSHDSMKEVKIFNSEQSELVIHDMPEFKRYEVTVWAENKEGATPRTGRQTKAVYSSEGKPLDSPRNFKVGYYNGTYGEFSWDPVNPSSERVKGFFRGYRIKFWKTDDPNNFRVEDILVNDKEIDLCPDVSEIISYRRKRQSSRNSDRGGATHKLWPFSKITAGVSVLNSAHSGDLSDTIEFTTPEGPPEAVKDLEITEIGSSHLIAAWSLPTSSNGVVTSFILEYQVDPQQVGILRKEIINDPNIMTRKIMGLQPDTMYRVTLYAVTTAGPGQAMFKDATTLSDTHPDKPRISKVEAGEDSANVTFDATDKPPKQNPGSRFYVEYAKEGPGHTWNKTDLDPHSPDNWVHVDKLEPGTYFFRVVALNGRHGHEKETRSDTMTIEIGERRDYEVSTPRHDAQIQLAGASAGWFIVLMCIIVLLLIILLIICCIKRSKGDMYPVYEKEKMLGRDPFAPDDAPFGEYNSSGRPDRSRSQGSLDSDDKPMESDTDSLGEYEDQDASKFNEDGSFIGLYGGKGRPKPEPTGPSVNTFV